MTASKERGEGSAGAVAPGVAEPGAAKAEATKTAPDGAAESEAAISVPVQPDSDEAIATGPVSEAAEQDAEEASRIQRARIRVQVLQARATDKFEELRARHESVEFAVTTGERDRVLAGSLVAGAVAYRMFLVLVPFVVVLVALAGFFVDLSQVSAEKMVAKLGMLGLVASSVTATAEISTTSRWTMLIIGLWILLLTSRSLARALRTAHALAWGMPLEHWPGALQASLAVMGGMLFAVLLMLALSALSTTSIIVNIIGTLVTAVALLIGWAWVSSVLPHRDVGWRGLLPGSTLLAISMMLVNMAIVYFTWRAQHASSFYGALGLSIVLLFWLYVLARVIIAAAVLNASYYVRETGIALVPSTAPGSIPVDRPAETGAGKAKGREPEGMVAAADLAARTGRDVRDWAGDVSSLPGTPAVAVDVEGDEGAVSVGVDKSAATPDEDST
jgi:uncharacterized BrkB/YihY/UPF0761 family membrane protein